MLPQYPTPYYLYDIPLLIQTITRARQAACDPRFVIHYAVKANPIAEVLQQVSEAGLGADCVSAGEVRAAIEAGIAPEKIVFAGVAKTDAEIRYALEQQIFCLNVESVEELQVINDIAKEMHLTARVCLRLNPDIDAHTNKMITTGLKENKFGIQMSDAFAAISLAYSLGNIEFLGLHFHIGSQITTTEPFILLCQRINKLVSEIESELQIEVKHINVGGGLGINYDNPDAELIPDFSSYFDAFRQHLHLRPTQHLHFELGRSIVGQCGSLITRVLYLKHGHEKDFVIVDAGMTELIRPALYHALHKIDNLTAIEEHREQTEHYDVVGPICESSDVFATDYPLPLTKRGDLIAIRSAGAYGEIMASQYNLRPLPKHYVLV